MKASMNHHLMAKAHHRLFQCDISWFFQVQYVFHFITSSHQFLKKNYVDNEDVKRSVWLQCVDFYSCHSTFVKHYRGMTSPCVLMPEYKLESIIFSLFLADVKKNLIQY